MPFEHVHLKMDVGQRRYLHIMLVTFFAATLSACDRTVGRDGRSDVDEKRMGETSSRDQVHELPDADSKLERNGPNAEDRLSNKNDADVQMVEDFVWVTNSSDVLWVNSASNFQYDPMCGFVGEKKMNLPLQTVPNKTMIEWWYGFDRNRPTSDRIQRTDVVIPSRDDPAKTVLVFIYHGGDWTVRWDPPRVNYKPETRNP